MDKETGRLDVELFADVLADLDQIITALPASTRFRLMAVLDARQMFWQGLTTGTRT